VEAERLVVAEFEGVKDGDLPDGQPVKVRGQLRLPGVEDLRGAGVQQDQAVNGWMLRRAPGPVARVRLPDVAQKAAAVRAGHALDELGRKPGDHALGQAKPPQPGRGVCQVQGAGAGEPARRGDPGQQPGQQRAPSGRVVGGEDREPGVREVAVPPGDQALDVVEVEFCGHGCLTGARASAQPAPGPFPRAGPPGSGRCSRCCPR
jgi:hypothetical protein